MNTPPWTDISSFHFNFQKHCNPFYPEIHKLLNSTYSQSIRELDVIFDDGSARTTIKKDVINVIRGKIIELIISQATMTQDTSLVHQLLNDMPMFSRLADDSVAPLKNRTEVLETLKNVRDSGSMKVIIYLDIDALHFRPSTSVVDFFNPKRFEDISKTPFPTAPTPAPATAKTYTEQIIQHQSINEAALPTDILNRDKKQSNDKYLMTKKDMSTFQTTLLNPIDPSEQTMFRQRQNRIQPHLPIPYTLSDSSRNKNAHNKRLHTQTPHYLSLIRTCYNTRCNQAMAAITKSMKTRSRGGIPFLCVIAIIICLGTMQTLNQDYLSDSPESYTDSPLLSIVVPKLSFPKSNEDYFRNPSVSLEKKVYMFHHTLSSPTGTEGAVVLDMLLGHVYAFHQGGIYSGSCGEGNDVGREPENSIITAIGLQNFLQFACPRDLETKDRKKVIPGKSYIEDGTRAFTPEYIDLLRSVIKYPKKRESQRKTNIIVVHMSRGKKFTPCRNKLHRDFEPYLPNKHYQLLINKYLKDGYENKVIIYSQSESYEKFDEFREKGYELHIDEVVSDVWKAVLISDVFIMSRSSFSFVPAMVAGNSTTVVYTPFWDQPIRGWNIVRKDIQAQSDAELQRLKSTCKKNDKLAKH